MRHPMQIFRVMALMFTIAVAGSLLSGCSETPTAGPGASGTGENAEGEKYDPGPAPEGQSEPEPDGANEKIVLPIPDQSSNTPTPANLPDGKLRENMKPFNGKPKATA